MDIRWIAGLLLMCAVMLGACSTSPSAPPQAAAAARAPTAPAAAPAQLAQRSTPDVQVAYRFAAPDTIVAPMPTGMVLLVQGQEARNIAFCHAFFAAYPSAEDAIKADPAANVFQTFLPLRSTELPRPVPAAGKPGQVPDCQDLINNKYDYQRAAWYLRTIAGYLHHGMGKPLTGPVLLAMTGLDPAKGNVVLDASGVSIDPTNPDTGQAAFEETIQRWTLAGNEATKVAAQLARAQASAAPPPPPGRRQAPPRPLARHNTSLRTTATACSPPPGRLQLDHFKIEIKLVPDDCAPTQSTAAAHTAIATASARGTLLATATQIFDPDTDPVLGFGCSMADWLKDTHVGDLVGAALPDGVVLVGEYTSKAICDRVLARGISLLNAAIAGRTP